MRFQPAALEGVVIIEPDVFRDERGFFLESYHREKYRAGGIDGDFVQDNHSRSGRATLRGLHAQVRKPQGKLVRAIEGTVYDVAVDIRRDSPTFAHWVAVELSAESFRQLYVPPGFAHGFCVLGEHAQVEYKCTDLYDPEDEIVVAWNDPEIGIEWPIESPRLSERDRTAPRLRDVLERLPPSAGPLASTGS